MEPVGILRKIWDVIYPLEPSTRVSPYQHVGSSVKALHQFHREDKLIKIAAEAIVIAVVIRDSTVFPQDHPGSMLLRFNARTSIVYVVNTDFTCRAMTMENDL